ncbi:unnamed protein product, partial [Rotaria sp. Silwood1]
FVNALAKGKRVGPPIRENCNVK